MRGARHPSPMRLTGALCVALAAGCGGVSDPEPEPTPLDPSGIWQYDEVDVVEITLELADNGSFERVEADRITETCSRTTGSWSADGATLLLDIDTRDGAPASGTESIPFQRQGGTLLLEIDGASVPWAPAFRVPSCVRYGWGAWEGRLEAEVDGVPVSFDHWTVDLDVDGGTLAVRAYPCETCGPDDPELVLEIDGTPDPLVLGSYTVQNVPEPYRSFFALYHPDPGDPDFQGFTTERLSPPGELRLDEVADERVRTSFFFQGNPRADGEMSADGRTTVSVSEGIVDLTYR